MSEEMAAAKSHIAVMEAGMADLRQEMADLRQEVERLRQRLAQALEERNDALRRAVLAEARAPTGKWVSIGELQAHTRASPASRACRCAAADGLALSGPVPQGSHTRPPCLPLCSAERRLRRRHA